MIKGKILIRTPECFRDAPWNYLTIHKVEPTFFVNKRNYPKSIDILEFISYPNTIENSSRIFLILFKDLFRKLFLYPNVFILRIQIGEDSRFRIPQNTSPKVCRARIRELFSGGLLSESESQHLLNISDNPKLFFPKLNNYRFIYWTYEEIIQEKKVLPGKKEITLKEALCKRIIPTLDLAWFTGNEFTEITCYYCFEYLEDVEKERICPKDVFRDYFDSNSIRKTWVRSAILDEVFPEKVYSSISYSLLAIEQVLSEINLLRSLKGLPDELKNIYYLQIFNFGKVLLDNIPENQYVELQHDLDTMLSSGTEKFFDKWFTELEKFFL